MSYWDEKYSKSGFEWGKNQTAVAEVARDFMHKKGYKKILDIGCGYGRDCIYLAKNGYHVLKEVDIHEVHQGGDEHSHREWLMVAEKSRRRIEE